MSKRFHVIVTGETGRSFSLQFSKRKVYLSLSTVAVVLMAVSVTSYFTTGAYFNSKRLSSKVGKLKVELEHIEKSNNAYTDQIAELKRQQSEVLASLVKDQDALIRSQQQEYDELIADQQVKFDLESTNLRLENVRLMSTAVSDLNQRSQLIESVMDTIGVKLKKESSGKAQENSGGPFVPDTETSYDDLVKQVDDYVKTIRSMPLGKPITGRISSRYGKRSDPVNKKKAIHEGVDIKGKRGARILATASGKVTRAFKNGGYGNYVEIDHGNGYITAYGHMQNYLVKKGEYVDQGQVIGQVGSSGRSTGPHLHYEIRLNKKPINPEQYMKVADISHTLRTIEEKN